MIQNWYLSEGEISHLHDFYPSSVKIKTMFFYQRSKIFFSDVFSQCFHNVRIILIAAYLKIVTECVFWKLVFLEMKNEINSINLGTWQWHSAVLHNTEFWNGSPSGKSSMSCKVYFPAARVYSSLQLRSSAIAVGMRRTCNLPSQ
jgi:hypothetical protein